MPDELKEQNETCGKCWHFKGVGSVYGRCEGKRSPRKWRILTTIAKACSKFEQNQLKINEK